MSIILGIESTAHTFGIGIVKNGKILSNVKHTYTTESGGIIPTEAAKHHELHKNEIYFEALDKANVKESEINAIAFSQGPGLAPCLLEGMKFAKELIKKLNISLIPVNHCVAHLEIGKLTKTKDPVLLYASGANTQVIAYASGKYRVFGETLDIGVGNFIDTFARQAGIGFPGGPIIEKLAEKGKNYIELPYSVKGMDISLSGILTNLGQKLNKMNEKNLLTDEINYSHSQVYELSNKIKSKTDNYHNIGVGDTKQINYTLSDLAYSLQETVFSMLIEVAERALAHTGKKELLIGGGVGCNKRLQEMCKIMCKERGAEFFAVENSLLTDNGAMIAYLGEIIFKSNKNLAFKGEDAEKLDILPRQRTDDVIVSWRK